MPSISVMVKPASSLCNLKCEYCFYHSLAGQRESYNYGIMDEDTLDVIIQKALSYAEGGALYLSFQGGEPLLAGKSFFRFASSALARRNKYHSPITLAVQTNGTLLDNEWCRIFAEGNYLVGLSLDGDQAANARRVDKSGAPVFERILAAARMLKEHGVEFNILSVLTEQNAKRIKPIYEFLTAQGFRHLQFIPYLKALGANPDAMTVTAETYGEYLTTLFDLYLRDIKRNRYVSIRQMDNFVALAKGGRAEQCGMNGVCAGGFVIEGDGTVFPCDFYCLDQYKLGNIKENGFDYFAAHPTMRKFIADSVINSSKCRECPYYRLCRGGCKRERTDLDKCHGYKKFFARALPELKKIY